MYKYSSLQPIIDTLYEQELWPSQIAEILGKNVRIINKYLKELINQWKIIKTWSWPHTKYKLTNWEYISNVSKPEYISSLNLKYQDSQIIEDNFLKFTPNGSIQKWLEWFVQRCIDRSMNPNIKAEQYIKTYKYIYDLQNDCGLIPANHAMENIFDNIYIDELYYADRLNWMEFGRWKLWEMSFFAKQSQNIKLINEAIDMIILKLKCIIKFKKIDAIAVIPPSIIRKNQFLKILKKKLEIIWLPFVNIVKYYPHKIPIPQKSLKKREERIQNARDTIIVDDKNISKYKNIIMIDDFVWSGSTLNETAKKFKEISQNIYIIWFALVGNLNLQYDVIKEI